LATYLKEKQEAETKKATLDPQQAYLQGRIDALTALINARTEEKASLNEEFYSRYHRFI
jgi:hypothetical protein